MALGGVDLPSSRISPAERFALRTNLPASRSFIASRARQLELEAARLRDLSLQLHRDQVRDDLASELSRPEDSIDLARAALLVARLAAAPAAQLVTFDRSKQRKATTAAKASRIKRSGQGTQRLGHTAASGRRAQRRRDIHSRG
jgi:hypothetical protein